MSWKQSVARDKRLPCRRGRFHSEEYSRLSTYWFVSRTLLQGLLAFRVRGRPPNHRSLSLRSVVDHPALFDGLNAGRRSRYVRRIQRRSLDRFICARTSPLALCTFQCCRVRMDSPWRHLSRRRHHDQQSARTRVFNGSDLPACLNLNTHRVAIFDILPMSTARSMALLRIRASKATSPASARSNMGPGDFLGLEPFQGQRVVLLTASPCRCTFFEVARI